MTRLIQFANNATSKLVASLSAVGTSISVIPGDGAKFPTLSAGQYFMATLVKSDGTKEVVKVTARTTDTLTVVRAAEAVGGVQTAYSFSSADRIELRLTAGELSTELDRLDRHALTGVLNKSANYTAVEDDVSTLVRVDSTSGQKTITLPLISALTDDFIIAVSKISSDLNAVYIAGSGGNTINGATPYALVSQWQGAWLVADRSTNTWTAVSSGVGTSFVFVDKFTGTGAQTAFTLSAGVYSSNQVEVTISGVTQNPEVNYTASGTTLTFTTAPPLGLVILARYTQSAPQVSSGTCTIEKQTATASQTGFALANGYIPGSNTMQVFVNGLLLASGTDYTEAGPNSVVFASGLTFGDEVQFVVYGQAVGVADASNVGYLPAGTGAVATDVQSKLRESVSVLDFGAVGDGVTDDTAAFTNAASAAGTKWVFVPSALYKITGTVTGNFYSTGTATIVTGTVKSIYDLPSRVNKARHPSGTNTILGDGSLDDVNLTGTIGYRNTAIGVNALRDVSTAGSAGGSNTATGFSAGIYNTTGSGNCSYGGFALGGVTTADHNNAFGYQSQASANGVQNNSFGFRTLYSLLTGNNNVAFGESALYSMTSGDANTFAGAFAGYSKASGNNNTAFGYQAQYTATTATGNTSVGYKSLFGGNNDSNSAFGYEANTNGGGGQCSSFGYQAHYRLTSGAYNSSFGWLSGFNITTGSSNTTMGQQSGVNISTGSQNACFGDSAGFGLATSSNNVAIGSATLTNLDGGNNTAVGFSAAALGAPQTWSNTTSLGYQAAPTGSNQVTLGNASVATLRCQVTTITALSDQRDKDQITPLEVPDAFLDEVLIATWVWNIRTPEGHEPSSRNGSRDLGVISQQLLALQKKHGVEWLGLVDESNPDRLEATPGKLLYPLIQKVQRQSALIASMEARLAALEAK